MIRTKAHTAWIPRNTELWATLERLLLLVGLFCRAPPRLSQTDHTLAIFKRPSHPTKKTPSFLSTPKKDGTPGLSVRPTRGREPRLSFPEKDPSPRLSHRPLCPRLGCDSGSGAAGRRHGPPARRCAASGRRPSYARRRGWPQKKSGSSLSPKWSKPERYQVSGTPEVRRSPTAGLVVVHGGPGFSGNQTTFGEEQPPTFLCLSSNAVVMDTIPPRVYNRMGRQTHPNQWNPSVEQINQVRLLTGAVASLRSMGYT